MSGYYCFRDLFLCSTWMAQSFSFYLYNQSQHDGFMKRLFSAHPVSVLGLGQLQSLYGIGDGFVPYKQSAFVVRGLF
jgi:hypothetical protein